MTFINNLNKHILTMKRGEQADVVWRFDHIFGALYHYCDNEGLDELAIYSLNQDHPCPYCGEHCPDFIKLAAKLNEEAWVCK
jgi:hypothetical protein